MALLLLPSLVVFAQPAWSDALAWRPGLAWREPWRAVSAAWVHLSAMHLGANAAGVLLVGALGVAARVPWPVALAWLLAWPLTHIGLLFMPALARYGGMSGVLHAGVAVIACALIARRAPAEARDRRLGWAIAAVLVFKIVSEAPWRGPLAHPAGWDIAIAPIAHASGALAGLATALLVGALARVGRVRQPAS